jgi:hypothetical protein
MNTKKLLALTAAIVLLVPLVTGCSLSVGNGFVTYDNPNFRGIAFTRDNHTVINKDGSSERKTDVMVDTSGQPTE